jgi:hypothetical protein
MLELLVWLEASALGQWIRSSGVWTYGLLNLGHIIGISTLFGSVVILDLKLLGLWRSVPLAMMARPTVPLSVFGFVLAIASGVCMLSVNGSEYVGNPFLLIKFPAIGLGLINVLLVSFLPEWQERDVREATPKERTRLAIAGAVSLLAWTTAVAAGRMIGYW